MNLEDLEKINDLVNDRDSLLRHRARNIEGRVIQGFASFSAERQEQLRELYNTAISEVIQAKEEKLRSLGVIF